MSSNCVERYPVLSLFCGSGGLDEGFLQAGFWPVLAVDLNPAACKTYKDNHPGTKVLNSNILSLNAFGLNSELASLVPENKIIGVIGGPPCQAFSQGNTHKKNNDKRARLTSRYLRLITDLSKLRPVGYFVFENVVGLTRSKHIDRFNKLLNGFKRAGFVVHKCFLNAKDYGVAQARPRIFIVGFNPKILKSIELFKSPPAITSAVLTVNDAIGSLAEPTFFKRGLTKAESHLHPNHWCMMPKSKKFKTGVLLKVRKSGRSFRVLDPEKPSPTVAYGHNEVSVHPKGHRRISVYEAMLLQGFPETYSLLGTLSEQIRLVSDAVPPPMAKALATQILKVLNSQGISKGSK